MPSERHGIDDEELAPQQAARFHDFDCPVCNANNPYDEPFGDGDEIRCFYCGQEFQVRLAGRGFRLREL